jgi:hypothetical protein
MISLFVALAFSPQAHAAADWGAVKHANSLQDVKTAVYGFTPNPDEYKIVSQFQKAADMVLEAIRCEGGNDSLHRDSRNTSLMGAQTMLDAIQAFNDDTQVQQMASTLTNEVKTMSLMNRDDRLCR